MTARPRTITDHLPAPTREEVLRRLHHWAPYLAERYNATGLALFGSVIHGEQTTTSDLDLLADFDDSASLLDLIGLAPFLEEQLGYPVDVVPRRALRAEIRERVLCEALPV